MIIVSLLKKRTKATVAICDTGSSYKTKAALINTSGLYGLILSSKTPKARERKH